MRSENRKALLLHPAMRPQCLFPDEKPSINAESETSTTSVEETARDVIKGIYGNGNVRKDRLGSRYQTVQDRVNEMYRQGLVH